ncbi:MAG: HipA domain-containing protein [Bacteroidetes bacterium]|uniref:HipA domain-containing protein n=1 Tax=Phnomibacter sp. TaxID=2836217 RepID=UPI002FDCC99A|nr:HipA domain-containing protein [Bacteroidota bacterium]
MFPINICPATLQPGYATYSPKALRYLFNGRKVSHVLPMASPNNEGMSSKPFFDNRSRISISGVQVKYSLKLDKNKLVLTDSGGEFILKPIPDNLMNVSQVPANEHLTMQIAEQVYGMSTAKNALIFFEDGTPAYLTKRFDVKRDGTRCLKEDFASLALLTEENAGTSFKYNYSYLQMAELIDHFFPASIPAKERFFQLVVFNYLFSNGDAHLKNFGRIDCEGTGFGMLAPAYDLVCTRLHIEDGDFALHDRLYEKDYEHPSYAHYGYHAYDDFYDFGLKMGLLPVRVQRILNSFLHKTEAVEALVANSFLSPTMRQQYLHWYHDKLRRLQTSMRGLKTAIG